MFPLVPAYPGCPGSKAVKRSLLLVVVKQVSMKVNFIAKSSALKSTYKKVINMI